VENVSPGVCVPEPCRGGVQDEYGARLEAVVRDFDRDPRESRRRMRELLDGDREGFCAKALDLVKKHGDSRAARCLVVLLVANNLLRPALCDPGLSGQEAVAVARAVALVDPMLDFSLARALTENSDTTPANASRLIQILSEISDGTQILPWLARLLRHPDPHIRSKAVLLVGRGGRSVRWAQKRMAEEDSRVRANAVESLWRVDTAEAHTLLEQASRDGNNRVAGNALLGLYWLGDCASLPGVQRIARSESSLFRSTAAWVMGRTGDPRFTEVLAGMLRDPNAAVRKRAFSALAGMRSAAAQAPGAGELRVAAHFTRNDCDKESRQVRVAVLAEGGVEHADILPTHFLLAEDGRQVFEYEVAACPPNNAIAVAFILPGAAGGSTAPPDQGALGCLEWKRPADVWAVLRYGPEAPDCGKVPASESDGPAAYTASGEAAASALSHPEHARDDMWTALWRAVHDENGFGRGRRHLLVVTREYIGRVAGHGILSAIRNSATSVQVISTVENPAIEDFCGRVQGSYYLAAGEQDVAALVEQAYLGLLARYAITYRSAVPPASRLTVRVHSPGGWGRTEIAIPPGEAGPKSGSG
jgi:hypothetical protein